MEHVELGMNLVKQAIDDLSGVGKADDEPKLNGRFIIVNLSPLPQNQRALRFNTLDDLEVEDQDDQEDHDDEDDEDSIEDDAVENTKSVNK